MTTRFNYDNTDITQTGGEKIVRKVSIRNGKGYKSVTKYYKGKKVGSVKKPIRSTHIMRIRSRKFIPRLFSDCKCGEKNKTRKRR
jgi:hypothetical protein